MVITIEYDSNFCLGWCLKKACINFLGVLLHYDDATLKDLYFLDPQWLCDMLAHVVTIREINPFARTGVMKLDDLKHVFKASNIGPIDTRGYVVNLLNKFEVALTWDSRTLLIPSLLPSEEDMIIAQMYPGQAVQPLVKVKVKLKNTFPFLLY